MSDSSPALGSTGLTGAGLRGRGVRLPRTARRKQLLGAAQEVFVSQGYHAAAMDEIADRAGVSKPVLYQHFPGKLELYVALLDQHHDELVENVRHALTSTTDNQQRVRNTIAAYYDFVAGDGEAFRLVFESDLRNEPLVAERVERTLQLCADAVAATIAADTGMSTAEAHLMGIALGGLAEVSARYWLTTDQPLPRDRAIELVAGLAWRGIGGFPRTG